MTEARGFPAFPAQRGRSTRGKSWWARAWVQAMEDTSLDSDQLRKGRRYANSGQVGPITVSPGRIAAIVEAPEDSYEAVVLVDRLGSDQWRRFLDQVAARAGHVAALLDGEMPPELVAAAEDAGVPLLPGIGDLDPSCTCDAWELPCQHAAGLCYQVAWLLDQDPFVLLLMRGRSREDLLDDLQARSTSRSRHLLPGATDEAAHEKAVNPARAAAPAQVADKTGSDKSAGEPAGDVFTTEPGPLPALPELPAKVALEHLPIIGTQPLPELPLLPLLVLDAARRARAQLAALLTGDPEPWVLDEWQDAVRLAADFPEFGPRLAEATGRPEALAAGVRAWTYGGAPGLDVFEHSWTPESGDVARARSEVQAAADDPLDVVAEANRLTTSDGRQLRLDRAGRWHPYRREGEDWVPAGPPDRDPVTAFAEPPG